MAELNREMIIKVLVILVVDAADDLRRARDANRRHLPGGGALVVSATEERVCFLSAELERCVRKVSREPVG